MVRRTLAAAMANGTVAGPAETALSCFTMEKDGRAHVADADTLRKEGIDLLVRDVGRLLE